MPGFDRHDGIVRFKFEDEEYVVRFKTEDLKQMLDISLQYKSKKEFDMVTLKKIHLEILKRSYPLTPVEKMDAFLDSILMSYHTEFMIGAKLMTRTQIDEMGKKVEADFLKAATLPG